MEKAYKIAQAKLWPWKISTQNMCKKKLKISQHFVKMPKNAQKMQKTFKKRVQKQKINTAVKN